MKRIVCLLIILTSGCMQPKESPKAAPQSTTTATTQAPAPGNSALMSGGSVMTGDAGSLASPAAPTAPPTATTATSDPKQSFGTQPANLVDLSEAQKNPKIVIVTGKITGADPITAAAQAYFSVPAKAQIANFQNQVRITKALNDDKPLSHDQFMELVRQLRIEFLPLPPWQLLGYDSKSGDIVVLEDKGEKIRRYKERNIPIEDADKQYDTP